MKMPSHTKKGPGRKHSNGKGTLSHGVMKGVTHAPNWKGKAFKAKEHFRARLVAEMQIAGYRFILEDTVAEERLRTGG